MDIILRGIELVRVGVYYDTKEKACVIRRQPDPQEIPIIKNKLNRFLYEAFSIKKLGKHKIIKDNDGKKWLIVITEGKKLLK